MMKRLRTSSSLSNMIEGDAWSRSRVNLCDAGSAGSYGSDAAMSARELVNFASVSTGRHLTCMSSINASVASTSWKSLSLHCGMVLVDTGGKSSASKS